MTASNVWTEDRVLAELLTICEDNPDTVNPWDEETAECVYDDGNEGRCLVGAFLFRNSFTVPRSNGPITAFIETQPDDYAALNDDDVKDLLQNAQGYADNGDPWGTVGSLLHAEYGDPRIPTTEGDPS